jgi:hypothetical protein
MNALFGVQIDAGESQSGAKGREIPWTVGVLF